MRIETDEFRIGQRAIFDMAFTVNNGPASPATVTMDVLQPDGATVDPITVTLTGDSATASYDPTVPGWHVYRVVADGNGVHDAQEGRFYVHPASIAI